MTTKHTPGPWYNGKDAQGNPIICQEYDTEMLFGAPNFEFQANCRLIDAAPDLLDALKDLVSVLGPDSGEAEIVAARAAIEKAVGAA